MLAKNVRHIAGMDVGTSKITVIIAEVKDDLKLEVIGTSTVESRACAAASLWN